MAEGLAVFSDRGQDGGPVLALEGEEPVEVFREVSMAVGSQPPTGPGALHLSNKRLFWLPDAASEPGYHASFRAISLHAVCREAAGQAEPPYLYCQIDGAFEADGGDGASDEDMADEYDATTEVKLVPRDPSCLDAVFAAFSKVAALNPDSDDEEDEDDGFFYNSEEALANATAEELEQLRRLDDMLEEGNGGPALQEDGRFEDAEEDDS
ncbi:unnamed protein product [Pedinophyceae sp. YPF-701]|nr:unnamed protein product [Pedinophyceae sp. YPF-701]